MKADVKFLKILLLLLNIPNEVFNINQENVFELGAVLFKVFSVLSQSVTILNLNRATTLL